MAPRTRQFGCAALLAVVLQPVWAAPFSLRSLLDSAFSNRTLQYGPSAGMQGSISLLSDRSDIAPIKTGNALLSMESMEVASPPPAAPHLQARHPVLAQAARSAGAGAESVQALSRIAHGVQRVAEIAEMSLKRQGELRDDIQELKRGQDALRAKLQEIDANNTLSLQRLQAAAPERSRIDRALLSQGESIWSQLQGLDNQVRSSALATQSVLLSVRPLIESSWAPSQQSALATLPAGNQPVATNPMTAAYAPPAATAPLGQNPNDLLAAVTRVTQFNDAIDRLGELSQPDLAMQSNSPASLQSGPKMLQMSDESSPAAWKARLDETALALDEQMRSMQSGQTARSNSLGMIQYMPSEAEQDHLVPDTPQEAKPESLEPLEPTAPSPLEPLEPVEALELAASESVAQRADRTPFTEGSKPAESAYVAVPAGLELQPSMADLAARPRQAPQPRPSPDSDLLEEQRLLLREDASRLRGHGAELRRHQGAEAPMVTRALPTAHGAPPHAEASKRQLPQL